VPNTAAERDYSAAFLRGVPERLAADKVDDSERFQGRGEQPFFTPCWSENFVTVLKLRSVFGNTHLRAEQFRFRLSFV